VSSAASADPFHSTQLPEPPASAAAVFGSGLAAAVAFAEILATDGVLRGLIGPREVPRLWERHLLNCAVLTDLLPAGARIVDVGSGAGLPGLPMVIRRPDLRIDLVEPKLRATEFLIEAVRRLGLSSSVQVVRGRTDDPDVLTTAGSSDWVVARAVAPLDRLVRWCFPLLSTGGRLLALKGATAEEEVATHRESLRRSGAGEISVQYVGDGLLADPTWVVTVERAAGTPPTRRSRR
jgi:16S rRNA (guanine527-N7)-methyltransferase